MICKHEAIIWQRFFVLLVFVFLAPLCISPVNAVPLSDALQSSSQHGFSLAVRPRSDASRRDFVRDWAAAHRRWGHGGVPKEVATKFSLSDSPGRVDVVPMGSDDIYLADVQIGNPPQTVKLALDTGSSDLWLQSTDTEYLYNVKGPWAPLYRPNESTTSHLIEDAKWSVMYMDGTHAGGIVYHDTVWLGDFKVENATVQSAKAVTSRFEEEIELSGILGLAKRLPNTVEPPAPSFLSLLRQQLKHQVFGVDMNRNASGVFTFGYLNESRASEDLVWVDTDPDSPHWDVEFNLTTWGAQPTTPWYSQPFMATIDTGTTLMFLPDNLASGYWLAVPGAKVDRQLSGAYSFPCELARGLPDLMLKIPGTDRILTIPGPYLNYGPSELDPSACWGGMQSADGLKVTVLGDIMLKALYLAFDLDKGRIGFAKKDLHDVY
ncbi:acid protease [Trichoderma reesei RUT C-30]|uniref:Acid protease n=1 Tax=Hypocrea jecorina (strain ATCC 56765 / BCRC 32924 / NRRL 11460 / Rut C-30) TaxID=1344414 RepID=A0A024SAE8_HYPJR|nr:acid protease [Trichoderma reesei RUT C-30]